MTIESQLKTNAGSGAKVLPKFFFCELQVPEHSVGLKLINCGQYILLVVRGFNQIGLLSQDFTFVPI